MAGLTQGLLMVADWLQLTRNPLETRDAPGPKPASVNAFTNTMQRKGASRYNMGARFGARDVKKEVRMLGLLRGLDTRPTQLRRLAYASGTALLLALAVILTPSSAVPAAAQGYGIYGGQCSLAFTCQRS